ncbi:hypothetical protein R3P38DRAFT_2765971 [Favolaschia claudopus]|uniref:Uncharacterized protein n=1 Tax=Favolaschia claudopus TaxID=2862362 RepID=A0AAW0D1D7_9AGAR
MIMEEEETGGNDVRSSVTVTNRSLQFSRRFTVIVTIVAHARLSPTTLSSDSMDLEVLLHPTLHSPSRRSRSRTTTSGSTEETPPDYKVEAFWRRVAYLTTRTKCSDGRWVVNALKDGHLRSVMSRATKKSKFLFAATRRDFFPTMEAFLRVYNSQPPAKSRSFQKNANKGLKKSIPHGDTGDAGLSSAARSSTVVYADSTYDEGETSEGFEGEPEALSSTRFDLRTDTRTAEQAASTQREIAMGRAGRDSIKEALTVTGATHKSIEGTSGTSQRAEASTEARYLELEEDLEELKRMFYEAVARLEGRIARALANRPIQTHERIRNTLHRGHAS